MLLVFAFGSGSRLNVWRGSHKHPVKECKVEGSGEGSDRSLFYKIDPAYFGSDVPVEALEMREGGRVIADPRVCFNIVQGAATLFVYRREADTPAMKFPRSLQHAIQQEQTDGLQIAVEFVPH